MTKGLGTTPSPAKNGWLYFYRGLWLKCPVCGVSPLFRPVGQMRNINDWFETLKGCPHCDYKYDRESGYFMAALWMFDYGLASLFGIILLLMLFFFFQLSTWQLLLLTLLPTFLFAVLFVRHAKAFWLAIDHFFHHHDEGE